METHDNNIVSYNDKCEWNEWKYREEENSKNKYNKREIP